MAYVGMLAGTLTIEHPSIPGLRTCPLDTDVPDVTILEIPPVLSYW